ncbi:Nitrogen assimilation regulatory protein [Serratia fonticola]|uniref:Nitrogen assimilation regulatory protein n=1 Tax=Serratia fonticola TaxID=47917 RepID=A0A4U9TJ84_SERFO|nr:Nitrogen assimilation regulatory protein [Serratia fonticola]
MTIAPSAGWLERALTGAGVNSVTFDSGNAVLEALATQNSRRAAVRYPHAGYGWPGAAQADQTASPDAPGHHNDAHSDLDAAVSAYQQGAFDYLPKPFDIDEAVALVERAISHYQEQQQPARNQPANDPVADIIW